MWEKGEGGKGILPALKKGVNIEVLPWANGNISVERINQEPSFTLEELRESKFHFSEGGS